MFTLRNVPFLTWPGLIYLFQPQARAHLRLQLGSEAVPGGGGGTTAPPSKGKALKQQVRRSWRHCRDTRLIIFTQNLILAKEPQQSKEDINYQLSSRWGFNNVCYQAVSISENDWGGGANVKFMISNSILTMQCHRPNVKIWNYWRGRGPQFIYFWGGRATSKVYKLAPMYAIATQKLPFFPVASHARAGSPSRRWRHGSRVATNFGCPCLKASQGGPYPPKVMWALLRNQPVLSSSNAQNAQVDPFYRTETAL